MAGKIQVNQVQHSFHSQVPQRQNHSSGETPTGHPPLTTAQDVVGDVGVVGWCV